MEKNEKNMSDFFLLGPAGWKTLLEKSKLLNLLLQHVVKDDALASALQSRIRDAVEEPQFCSLLMLRPEKSLEGSLHSHSWEVIFPITASLFGPNLRIA